MRQPKPQFWEDTVQANERLSNTVILYGTDPFYAMQVDARGSIQGNLYTKDGAVTKALKMDDPNFHRFRKLPPLGWVNSIIDKQAMFLDRTPTRSRLHGLHDQAVVISGIHSESGSTYRTDNRITRFVADKGYLEACHGIRPALNEVLLRIRSSTAISISEKYAVLRDNSGMRWLYRNLNKIGLFVGANTLMLLEGKGFYREELQSDPAITIANIREF